jgi:hypothetical protein
MGAKPSIILLDSKVRIKSFIAKIAHESKSKEKSTLIKENNKSTIKNQQTAITTGAKEVKHIGRHVVD